MIYLYVEDVDATVERALKRGGKLVVPVETQFWGDRMGQVQDPLGTCGQSQRGWKRQRKTRDASDGRNDFRRKAEADFNRYRLLAKGLVIVVCPVRPGTLT